MIINLIHQKKLTRLKPNLSVLRHALRDPCTHHFKDEESVYTKTTNRQPK